MEGGLHFKTKGSWKECDFSGAELSVFDDQSFGGLISMQELTDYEIIGSGAKTKKATKNEKKKVVKPAVVKTKKKVVEAETTETESDPPKKHLKEKNKKVESEGDIEEDVTAVDRKTSKRKAETNQDEPKPKKRKRKPKKKRGKGDSKNKENSSVEPEEKTVFQPRPLTKEVTENDLPGWKGMFVPSPVLRALKELGFSAPTPIQALTLPSAIRDRKDIVGAAETGSGKTLAFGIPLLYHILEKKSERKSQIAEQLDDVESIDDSSDLEVSSVASTDTSDDEEFPPKIESDEGEDEESDEEFVEIHGDGDEIDDDVTDDLAFFERPLYALILTPTRELAIQVANHIKKVAKYTDIRVTTLVGGISLDKQRRLLKKCPEIVVATPGRLWDLMDEGQPHLAKIPSVPYLVIDECDRMVEKGHFQELTSILELMNNDENNQNMRQTFVFSATLTFVHDAPNRFKKKRKMKKLTSDDKLENLMSHIGVKAKPKIVDLTRKYGTAETLTETKIHCSVEDKDVYLYYFLQQYPGRTLIFTNSKDCLRRLLSILTLLQCKPLPLHADMHQKQRLKNLERFTSSPNAVLLATDVAARGLDIPNVQHVIHFQVPQTAENYIHRSGRTARATKEGLSFLIIGPDDIKNYRKILRSLKRTEDIAQLPVDLKYLPGIKDRLALAKSIDQQEHKKAKAQHNNNWFIKAAKDMDIELEEYLLHDTGDSREKSVLKSRLLQLRAELKSLLKTPVISQNASHKYPTSSGRLVVPYMQSGLAIEHVRNSKPMRLNPTDMTSTRRHKRQKKNKK